MSFLKQLFTWWNGQTLNTRFYTWMNGEFVGTDEFGNKYYRAKSALARIDQGAPLGDLQRLFGSLGHSARLAWLDAPPHRRAAEPGETIIRREWQKPHIPNQTGTPGAYRPKGSILSGSTPAPRAADYSAWRPE